MHYYIVSVNEITGDVAAAELAISGAAIPPHVPGSFTVENYGTGGVADAAKDAIGRIMLEVS